MPALPATSPPLGRAAFAPERRDLADTHDLVQDVMFEAFRRLECFEIRGQGAFIAYLRRALLNRVSNEIRRVSRRPASEALEENTASAAPSALDEVLGREAVEWSESALQALSESDRTAIVSRVELRCSYDEIAQILDKSNAAAARQAVSRALRRLAEGMGRVRRA